MPSDDRILYLALGLLLTVGAVAVVALVWKVARRARASERLEQLGITVGIPKAATVQIALGVVALIALVEPDAVAARLRRRRGRCPRCGYSLRGLTEPRCPECGRPVTLPQDGGGATA